MAFLFKDSNNNWSTSKTLESGESDLESHGGFGTFNMGLLI